MASKRKLRRMIVRQAQWSDAVADRLSARLGLVEDASATTLVLTRRAAAVAQNGDSALHRVNELTSTVETLDGRVFGLEGQRRPASAPAVTVRPLTTGARDVGLALSETFMLASIPLAARSRVEAALNLRRQQARIARGETQNALQRVADLRGTLQQIAAIGGERARLAQAAIARDDSCSR